MKTSELLKSRMRAALLELRTANPHVDPKRFRIAKEGDSVALFSENLETGALIYTSTIGDTDEVISAVVLCSDGRKVSLGVTPCCYEGFPDPPRNEPKWKVGDRVKHKGGQSWIKNELHDLPEERGYIVMAVESTENYDRTWSHRCKVGTPEDVESGYWRLDAHESQFEADE